MPDPDLLTTAEAAERIGVKPRRVRQLYEAGDLPGVKLGDRLFFTEEAVAAFQRRPVGRPKQPDHSPEE